jgi:hypothetical protein
MVHAAAHHGCFEHRHPQDFVRAVSESSALPWTRPEPADVDIAVTYSTAVTAAEWAQIPEGTFNSSTIDDDQYNNITGDQGGGILVE